MRYRRELKYIIGRDTAAILRGRLRAVMRPDAHTGGNYLVNNLYFDDLNDGFLNAKLLGGFSRDKFRVRHYNDDMSFIRLERKHKDGDLTYKDTIPITIGQYQNLRNGDFRFILSERDALWQTLAVLHRLRTLRPTAAFTYRREAYTYPEGDVRVTFDGCPDGAPGAYGLLLEVKYSGFLPDVIARLLRSLPLVRTEMSKYGIVRERGVSHVHAQGVIIEQPAG